jgi:hypothetical protein
MAESMAMSLSILGIGVALNGTNNENINFYKHFFKFHPDMLGNQYIQCLGHHLESPQNATSYDQFQPLAVLTVKL